MQRGEKHTQQWVYANTVVRDAHAYGWPEPYLYGVFGREITKYTVIYGVNLRFWPTLYMQHGEMHTQGGSLNEQNAQTEKVQFHTGFACVVGREMHTHSEGSTEKFSHHAPWTQWVIR